MSVDAVALAASRRVEKLADEEIDKTLRTLLAHYETVTADPQKMGHLSSLLKHYAKSKTPWRDCYKDNLKRFGPKTAALCGVLKDSIRQSTGWRGHPARDVGAPGVAIAEADRAAMKLDDIPQEIWMILADLTDNCDPCRVMLGLDPAPQPSATFLSEYVENV